MGKIAHSFLSSFNNFLMSAMGASNSYLVLTAGHSYRALALLALEVFVLLHALKPCNKFHNFSLDGIPES